MSERQKKLKPNFFPFGRYYLDSIKRERQFLEYVKQRCDPQKVFYPGSGFDQVPRRVFGKDRCVYSTLTESEYYFKKKSPDVIADYRSNPFPDNFFDFVYIHGSPHSSLVQSVGEFGRVLKDSGCLAVVSDEKILEFDELVAELKDRNNMTDITPPMFKEKKYKYFVHQLDDELVGSVSRSKYLALRDTGESVWMGAHCFALLQG